MAGHPLLATPTLRLLPRLASPLSFVLAAGALLLGAGAPAGFGGKLTTPAVGPPADAIRTFAGSFLDALVLEESVVTR